MYPLTIGTRYMLKKRVTIICVAGVAVGVMALTVVLSVMNGFIRDIKAHIRGTLTDVVVHSRQGSFEYEGIIQKIREMDHVVACAPFVEGMALAKFGGAKQPVQFRGVIPKLQERVSHWDGQPGKKHNRLLNGRTIDTVLDDTPDGKPAVFAGQEMMRWKAKGSKDDPEADPDENFLPLGVQMVLVTVKDRISAGMGVRGFRLTGMFKTGMYEFDRQCVYISLKAAQELTGLGNKVTGISVKLDDYANAPQVRQQIETTLGPLFRTTTWEEDRATFIRAVEVERRVMGIILFFILVVAGFGIFAILTMVVMEKAKDIGTLRAIGATRTGIMGIFTFLGAAIGILGAGIGLGVGLVILDSMNQLEDKIYQWWGWRVFPQDVYYLDHIPHEISPWGVTICVAGAVITSLLASLYPAWRAANLDPVQSLRYE